MYLLHSYIIDKNRIISHSNLTMRYKIARSSKRKNVQIQILSSNEFIIKVPENFTEKGIIEVINKNRDKLNRLMSKIPKHQFRKYLNGDDFFYLGKKYRLIVDNKYPKYIKFDNGFYIRNLQANIIKEEILNWYHYKANEFIIPRIIEISNRFGFKYNKIGLTDAIRKWGSCTGKNNIKLSWRLIMAPIEVIDYVIIHELVHTIYKNHSKRFWQNVEMYLPNWKESRKWLKDNKSWLLDL